MPPEGQLPAADIAADQQLGCRGSSGVRTGCSSFGRGRFGHRWLGRWQLGRRRQGVGCRGRVRGATARAARALKERVATAPAARASAAAPAAPAVGTGGVGIGGTGGVGGGTGGSSGGPAVDCYELRAHNGQTAGRHHSVSSRSWSVAHESRPVLPELHLQDAVHQESHGDHHGSDHRQWRRTASLAVLHGHEKPGGLSRRDAFHRARHPSGQHAGLGLGSRRRSARHASGGRHGDAGARRSLRARDSLQ